MKRKILALLTTLLVLCTGLFVACGGGEKTALSAPVISLSGNVVSWTAVENAGSYEVSVNGEALADAITKTSYTITQTAVGSYIITVKALPANADNYNPSAASNSVTYTVVSSKLDTPVATLSGNVISWVAVSGAESYDVYVDGTLLTTETLTSYTFEMMEIKTYAVTVVAKASGRESSDPSVAVSYTAPKWFVKIEKLADPTVTTYYLDDNKALDLDGLSVKACYGNAADETITLTAANIISDYDLTVEGRHELEFEYVGANNVSSTIMVRIFVEERGISDIPSYASIVNEYSQLAASYKIADGTATKVVDMKGNPVAFSVDGGAVYANVGEGETLLRVDDSYVNVTVARYVETIDDFNAINDKLDGYYMLMNNLDFVDVTPAPIGKAPIVHATVADVENTPVLDETGASGIAFTGTFNGNGYAIRSYNLNKSGIAWNALDGRAVAIFGYIGETGKVCNLTLRDVSIKGMNHAAFIAGVNEGTVENIFVESDCSIFSNYAAGAVVSAYNYGTVKNVVSLVSTMSTNGSDAALPVIQQGEGYTADTGINGYVGNTTDLTAILGDGWTYIADYGTVYGNANYKKVIASDATIANGGQIEFTVYQKTWLEIDVAVWGASGYGATEVLEYKGIVKIDDNTYVFTFGVKEGVTLVEGASLSVGVTTGYANGGYFDLFTVTVEQAAAVE